MTEPTHLTYDQVLPIAKGMRRCEVSARDELVPVVPFPDCPACGQTPATLATGPENPNQFVHHRVAIYFSPCGHRATTDVADLDRAYHQASMELP
jgi:hypothetical protein